MPAPAGDHITLTVDGRPVSAPAGDFSLLTLLREHLGIREVKDGCSPQGQCGACTVLVDGAARVACVTPARRMAGRRITTLAGLDPARREAWADAFCATGASQCGFCTPGIILRLESLSRRSPGADPSGPLSAHLCRCTGWQTILEAARAVEEGAHVPGGSRDFAAAARRAAIEGGGSQVAGPHVACGEGGFADDSAPPDALVAVPAPDGGWALGETLAEARQAAGAAEGRRSTLRPTPPLEVPPGAWDRTLQTCWSEPAYLELDASWCAPPDPLATGGACGAKARSDAPAVARRLAEETGRPVRVLYSRPDATRLGPKRPPVAGGANADGSGRLAVARTPGIVEAVAAVAPGLEVIETDVAGPPTSAEPRAAGVLEALALLAGARGTADAVRLPGGGVATAHVGEVISVEVDCGHLLDEVVLRSYCIGAAHMAYSLVTSEAIATDDSGAVADLTVRSFGVVPASRTPPVDVRIVDSDGEPVNGSDAVFVAVAAATWLAMGCPPVWPTDRRS
ncbi:MAG: 2Fe-2S iron-sulfur cluster binding domain-containing protein [Acidimicrobiia bacterium]|nr:2Fe-2S iron-sulfur cluster binding domain-containing protein [Acidimicrobiia bacterium]